MKTQIFRNIWLSFLSVFIVSTVVYGALGWWEGVENAADGESLTHTVWNSLVDGVVKKTGSVAETITGIKTFSSSPIVPVPTIATQASNKQYVDSILSNSQLGPTITVLNNGADSDHDIDFTEWTFVFDDWSWQASAIAISKRIDAAWAAGNGQWWLDTGSVSSNSTYYMYAIYNPTSSTADFLFSTSLSPNMPSGYTKKKKVASLLTDSSANIKNGTWTFNPDGSYHFIYNTLITDLSDSTPATIRTAVTLSVPPNTRAKLNLTLIDNDTSSASIVITEEAQADVAPVQTNSTLVANVNWYSKVTAEYNTNSSSQIYYRASDGGVSAFTIVTRGWFDNNL